MMKRAGVLLLVLGLMQIVGGAMQGRIPEYALLAGAVLIVGGLIIWSLERIRDVLAETRDTARAILAILAIEAAEPDEVL